MIDAVRKRVTYSNAIATLALFIALGGVAVAAGLPRNSVGTRQLKRGAVTSAKLAKKSVINGKLGPNSVGPGNIGNGAVTTAKLAASSVIASTIKNGVITNNKLANEAVNSAKLAKEAVTSGKLGKESVTLAKLGPEVAPLLGTLKPGQTLRGVFDVGGTAAAGGDASLGAVGYQFPLLAQPTTVSVLQPGETNAGCGGLGGGLNQTPQAASGNLCVYVTGKENLNSLTTENSVRLGFGLRAKAEAGGNFSALGQWAVTAP